MDPEGEEELVLDRPLRRGVDRDMRGMKGKIGVEKEANRGDRQMGEQGVEYRCFDERVSTT